LDSRQPEPPQPVKDVITGLMRMDLRHVALVAFAIGVLFHVCVVYAVLDDGGGDPAETAAPRDQPVIQQPTPRPTQPPDRTDCAAIRGTDYRSEAERRWFQANCTGAIAPSPVPIGPQTHLEALEGRAATVA